MTLIYLLFSKTSLAVTLLLISPLLLPLSLSLAPRMCFKTWPLITYQFYYLFIFLWFFHPTNVPFPSIFRKLVGMTLLITSTLTVLLHRNSRLFCLSSAVALFTSMTLNAAESFIPFGRIKRNLKLVVS